MWVGQGCGWYIITFFKHENGKTDGMDSTSWQFHFLKFTFLTFTYPPNSIWDISIIFQHEISGISQIWIQKPKVALGGFTT